MTYKNPQEMRLSVRQWKKAYEFVLLMFLLLCLASLSSANAQVITHQTINSMGTAPATVGISTSVGEGVVATAQSATTVLTQGFQQTFGKKKIGIVEWDCSNSELQLYPNPTATILNIGFGQSYASAGPLKLALYNSSGQPVLFREDIYPRGGKSLQLDISTISQGMCSLVLSGNNFQSIHKIIKTK
ncbi:hypothetical protein Oweho_0591 [Owenweeksia hongkongensis DSM 17368]|uniref:Secretion system C-terminal sorting domain-containing protein n=1 Tax=Owenweeksia hongkongensis (strain DSM 17368 / CIP 108786 / JCM 12287 / NRRL B-23963 / UST20020801) TaxID=926562 RepID=G8R0E6_OWEHD|nr:T9SS type A sorting domain-containing protein [Owenweeksia hongkongensis]AEV31606.1 hypothetical protein Oweho_0591 [Owenweeksia hongkongensis DSM 17368]